MAKSTKQEKFGSLPDAETQGIYHAKLPKYLVGDDGVKYNTKSKWDRMAYVENQMRKNEATWGNVGGNYIKLREPNVKGRKKPESHTGAGLIHIQPLSKTSYFGMFDTGKEIYESDIDKKYTPNITLFKQKPKTQYVGNATNAAQEISERLMAVRRGQRPGKAVWFRGQRTWEKHEFDKAKNSGHPISIFKARELAKANPNNPMTYTTLERGSNKWFNAFLAIQANMEHGHGVKTNKAYLQGMGQLKKHDTKYLRNKLGIGAKK